MAKYTVFSVKFWHSKKDDKPAFDQAGKPVMGVIVTAAKDPVSTERLRGYELLQLRVVPDAAHEVLDAMKVVPGLYDLSLDIRPAFGSDGTEAVVEGAKFIGGKAADKAA